MNAYKSKFHDGFVDGVLIREQQVIILIRTEDNEAFALVADSVTRMWVDSFFEGNIIFDIVLRQGPDLNRSAVDIYGFAANASGEKHATELLSRSESRIGLRSKSILRMDVSVS